MRANPTLRITTRPEIRHGRPTIREMRIPLADVLELLPSGMRHEDILAEYPYLEREDIAACLEFAARLLRHDV